MDQGVPKDPGDPPASGAASSAKSKPALLLPTTAATIPAAWREWPMYVNTITAIIDGIIQIKKQLDNFGEV